jgi:hypothetical protein
MADGTTTKKKKAAAAAPAPAPAPAQVVQGTNPTGTDGCGLGWQVTDKKTLMGTTTRGTTNAFVPPSFGMSSGTIGCDKHEFAKNEREAAVYAYNNYESLSVEMAQGHGETLDGFAHAMGCGDAAAFGKMTQSNFKQIIEAPSAIDMFETVKSKIAADPSACRTII